MVTKSGSAVPAWDLKKVVDDLVDTIPKPTSNSQTANIVYFLHLLERLKTTPREGWRRHDIKTPESISDHMYRMSIISLLLGSDEGVDASKCMKLALVHDMAELLVGDITPLDGISKKDKNNRELTSMQYLASLLPEAAGKLLFDLWNEYETGETKEALFVKDVDKFELLLQMVEYERSKGKDLTEFWHVAKGIKSPRVITWVAELEAERKAAGAVKEKK